MEYIFKAISELLSIFRIHKEAKNKEIEIKLSLFSELK